MTASTKPNSTNPQKNHGQMYRRGASFDSVPDSFISPPSLTFFHTRSEQSLGRRHRRNGALGRFTIQPDFNRADLTVERHTIGKTRPAPDFC